MAELVCGEVVAPGTSNNAMRLAILDEVLGPFDNTELQYFRTKEKRQIIHANAWGLQYPPKSFGDDRRMARRVNSAFGTLRRVIVSFRQYLIK